jgi:hypothetical protein
MAASKASFGRRYEYLDSIGRIWLFKSSWELCFAQALDSRGILWYYEHVKLLLSDGRTYIPDFWVEPWKCYVEIKGWRSAEKAVMARKMGHDVRLIQGRDALRRAIWGIKQGVIVEQ